MRQLVLRLKGSRAAGGGPIWAGLGVRPDGKSVVGCAARTGVEDAADHARQHHEPERQQLEVPGEDGAALRVRQRLGGQRPLHHHLQQRAEPSRQDNGIDVR